MISGRRSHWSSKPAPRADHDADDRRDCRPRDRHHDDDLQRRLRRVAAPAAYASPDRLVRIDTDSPPNRFRFSVADYLALDAQQTHFERIAGYTDREMAFSDGVVAERLSGRVVSWTYFGLLGIQPAIGHDFVEQDGRPGSPPAVIVSRRWRAA